MRAGFFVQCMLTLILMVRLAANVEAEQVIEDHETDPGASQAASESGQAGPIVATAVCIALALFITSGSRRGSGMQLGKPGDLRSQRMAKFDNRATVAEQPSSGYPPGTRFNHHPSSLGSEGPSEGDLAPSKETAPTSTTPSSTNNNGNRGTEAMASDTCAGTESSNAGFSSTDTSPSDNAALTSTTEIRSSVGASASLSSDVMRTGDHAKQNSDDVTRSAGEAENSSDVMRTGDHAKQNSDDVTRPAGAAEKTDQWNEYSKPDAGSEDCAATMHIVTDSSSDTMTTEKRSMEVNTSGAPSNAQDIVSSSASSFAQSGSCYDATGKGESLIVKNVAEGVQLQVMLVSSSSKVQTVSELRAAIAMQRPSWANHELVANGQKLPSGDSSKSLTLSSLGLHPGAVIFTVASGPPVPAVNKEPCPGTNDHSSAWEPAFKSALVSATRAAPGVRELLLTIVGNLRRNGEDRKYRQVNDSAVRKRCASAGYKETLVVLEHLGFVLDEEDVPRWVFAGEIASVHYKLDVAERLLAAMAALAPSATSAAHAGAGTLPSVQPRRAGIAPTQLVVPGNGGSALRVLAFPRDYFELVSSQDAVAWAMCKGSRKWPARFGDDRATLTICSCIRFPVAAHWVTQRGEERTEPNAVSPPFGQAGYIETWVEHVFILRSQQGVICGLRIIGRPENGHLVVMVTDAAESRLEAFCQQCELVMAGLKDDKRDAPEQQQGRAPAPPPPGRNRRGPWG